MKKDLYKSHAYTEVESTEETEGFAGSTIKNIYLDTTCDFCGLVMRRKQQGFLIT